MQSQKQVTAYFSRKQLLHFEITQQNTAAIDITFGEGPGVMVKAAAWKVGAHGFVPRSGINISKKHVSFPPHSKRFGIVWSLCDRAIACSA